MPNEDELSERRKSRRGGARPRAGRPGTNLLLQLPKDYFARLTAFSREQGKPPDEVAAHLIMAFLESTTTNGD